MRIGSDSLVFNGLRFASMIPLLWVYTYFYYRSLSLLPFVLWRADAAYYAAQFNRLDPCINVWVVLGFWLL